MKIIFGNYGDNTIALIQWAHLQALENVFVVHVDTQGAASSWSQRVKQGQALGKKYGFSPVGLKSRVSLAQLVRERKSFPNAKYQWCPTFLKALPLLDWLDEVDPLLQATILLGSRRVDSRARITLTEFVEDSEHYGGRCVWYPLLTTNNADTAKLIHQSGLTVCHHRSLECDPCIHSSMADLSRLEQKSVLEVGQLEEEVNEKMFHSRYPNKSIADLVRSAKNNRSPDNERESLDRGCGSFFACGE